MASEWASELLAELETERDLKLKAEERSVALQQRADRAIRERDEARGGGRLPPGGSWGCGELEVGC